MALGGKLDGENLVQLREVPGRYSDGAGLYFVVQASGSAAWAYRYMLRGVAREMGLGPYPAVSLRKARERALAAAELKADGIDPLNHRRRLKAADALKESRIKTFKECATDYLKTHSPVWKSEVAPVLRTVWRLG